MKQPLAEPPTNYPLELPPNVNCGVTAYRLGVGVGRRPRQLPVPHRDTSEAGKRWSFLLTFEEVQEGSASCGHTLCRFCTADVRGASMKTKMRRRLRETLGTALV